MSRRSARIKAKIVGEDTALAPVPASLPQPVEPPEPATLGPSSTHLTAKRRTVQRKRGRSKSMPNMPLDVLIEIMAYLSPRDILSLSRTTKDLRVFLMRRSSASFWKAAYKNDETLPPCPADLSEPAYANLLYSAHCHNCVRNNCHHIFWEARVRLCRDCYPNLSTSDHHDYSILLPAGNYYVSSKDLYPRLYSNAAYYKEHRAYSPHVAQLQAAIASMNPEEKCAYLSMEERRVSEIKRTTPQLQQWHKCAQRSHTSQLSDIRTERKNSILSKLAELGYQPELDYMDDQQRDTLLHFPEVRRASMLSPQTWKTIEPRIVSYMNDMRESRLSRLRFKTRQDRIRLTAEIIHREFPDLRDHLTYPSELFFNIPQLRELVEPETGLLDQDKVTNVVKTELPSYLERRMQIARTHFQKLVLKDTELDAAIDPLSLAVGTYFRCPGCRTEPQTVAQALRHTCYASLGRHPNSEYHSAVNSVFTSQNVWQFERFRTVVQIAQRCVLLYGLDPTTATAEDMDSCTTRIKCLTHGTSPTQKRLTVHSWRSFLCLEYSCSDKCDLTQASEKEATAAIQLEAARRKKREEYRAERRVWRCVRCPDRTALRTKIDSHAHLQTEHGITEPKEDDLFYTTPGYPKDIPAPSILIPSEVEDLPESKQAFKRLLDAFDAVYFDFD